MEGYTFSMLMQKPKSLFFSYTGISALPEKTIKIMQFSIEIPTYK